MDIQKCQQKCINTNMTKLTECTTNLSPFYIYLLSKELISPNKKQIIEAKVTDVDKNYELYSHIVKAILLNPKAFDGLIEALESTENVYVAKFLKAELKKQIQFAETSSEGVPDLIQTVQSMEASGPGEISNSNQLSDKSFLSVKDDVLKIAEALEKNTDLRESWPLLMYMLDLPNENKSQYEGKKTFKIKAAFMLRDWFERNPKKATYKTLIQLLKDRIYKATAGAVEDLLNQELEEKICHVGGTSMKGQERAIANVLTKSPVANEWESLFFLLGLPLNMYEKYENEEFLLKANRMLNDWYESNPKATVEEFAEILKRNNFVATSDEILLLKK